jgi:pimeloyl-ACP methyl ester carboxylesterase
MPEITVGSATIPYEQCGSGPGLLLVHGTGANAEITWGQLIDRFSDIRTVLVPDLSGSDKVAVDGGGDLTIETLVEQLRAVVADAGGEPVDVVGFSLGATTAAAFAGSHPELVRRLVVISGLANTDEHLRNFVLVWRRIAGDAEAFGRFSALTAFSPGFLNMLDPEQVEGLVANVQPTAGTLRQIELLGRLDVRPMLAKITAPTLVIGSALDQTVAVGRARELHELIAGSSYAELESGHVVLFEQPDKVVELVREHLGS